MGERTAVGALNSFARFRFHAMSNLHTHTLSLIHIHAHILSLFWHLPCMQPDQGDDLYGTVVPSSVAAPVVPPPAPTSNDDSENAYGIVAPVMQPPPTTTAPAADTAKMDVIAKGWSPPRCVFNKNKQRTG